VVSLEFFIDIILSDALWRWCRLRLSKKRIPGIFSGGKGDRFVRLTTLPPPCADRLEIWATQTSGTLRASPGLYRGSLYL